MMATNMPDSARRRRCCGPGRIDRIYQVGYPSQGRPQAHLRGLPRQGEAHASRDAQVDKLATMTPYATGAIDQGHRERVADRGHPRRPRHRHVARRHRGQAAQGARHCPTAWTTSSGSATPSPSTRPATPSSPYRVRRRCTSSTSPPSRRRGRRRRLRVVDPARGALHRVAHRLRDRRRRRASPRWPVSGCSSAATTRPASAATSAAPPALAHGHAWPRAGMGDTHRLARGRQRHRTATAAKDDARPAASRPSCSELYDRAERPPRGQPPVGAGHRPRPARRTRRSPARTSTPSIHGTRGPIVDGALVPTGRLPAGARGLPRSRPLAAHQTPASVDVPLPVLRARRPSAAAHGPPWAPPCRRRRAPAIGHGNGNGHGNGHR